MTLGQLGLLLDAESPAPGAAPPTAEQGTLADLAMFAAMPRVG